MEKLIDDGLRADSSLYKDQRGESELEQVLLPALKLLMGVIHPTRTGS